MDALRLLSRGSKAKKHNTSASLNSALLPSGQTSKPQLFASTIVSKKRKRGEAVPLTTSADGEGSLKDGTGPSVASAGELNFFDEPNTIAIARKTSSKPKKPADEVTNPATQPVSESARFSRSLSDRRALLKQHKIKINVLASHKSKARSMATGRKHDKQELYPDPLLTFDKLATYDHVPKWLTRNLSAAGYAETTEVQMAALDLQLSDAWIDDMLIPTPADNSDLLIVAPTGSGKTLAFLIPTIVRIAGRRSQHKDSGRNTAALILAPTKELVDQIVNDGRRLSDKSGIKFTSFRKNMLGTAKSTLDEHSGGTVVKSDVLVSTPGALYSAFETATEDIDLLKSVRYLILDEADVLLDPLFREQTVSIWQKLMCPDLSVSLWSATMGSNIEELAQSIIQQRSKALSKDTAEKVAKRQLIRVVVGLKDSAVPNVQHKLIYAATEQGKLMGLRQLLHPATASVDSGPVLRPPFIIFTQTIDRAKALHSEMLYDIPAEAGGISRIAVLHSDLSDTMRESVMTRFRKGEVWVLITTDLLSRGIDFRGVNGVVNYDIPSSSAAYVHRVGRTGRAGREGGVAVTLYSKEDIPYLKHVANVVAAAQRQQGVHDGSGVQKWLLDALPTLSKNEKQRLKKRGVEVRTARGMAKDAKAARRARISTKAGYDRREENRKRQAIEASKRRNVEPSQTKAVDDDFGGFD